MPEMLPQIRKTENAISAESNVRSLSLRRFPTPVMYFMASVACIEPVIPGTGPSTPETAHGRKPESLDRKSTRLNSSHRG